MSLAEADDVLLAQHGLPACVEIDVGSEVLALCDDGVEFVIGERLLLLVGVVGCPAAGAVQVACRGGIHEDGPGAVALVFLAYLALARPTDGDGVHEKVDDEGSRHVAVDIGDDVLNEPSPVVARCLEVVHHHVEETQLLVVGLVTRAYEPVECGTNLGKASVEVLVEQVDCHVHCSGDCLCLELVEYCHGSAPRISRGLSPHQRYPWLEVVSLYKPAIMSCLPTVLAIWGKGGQMPPERCSMGLPSRPSSHTLGTARQEASARAHRAEGPSPMTLRQPTPWGRNGAKSRQARTGGLEDGGVLKRQL